MKVIFLKRTMLKKIGFGAAAAVVAAILLKVFGVF